MASPKDVDDRNRTCRACLVEDNSRTFSNLLEEPLNSIYFECTAVKVHEGDVVSTVICSLCVGRCDASKYFRDLAFATDQKLKLKYGEQVAAEISLDSDTHTILLQDEEDDASGDNIEIEIHDDRYDKYENGVQEGDDDVIETYEEIEEDELIVMAYEDELELETPPVMSPQDEIQEPEIPEQDTEELQTVELQTAKSDRPQPQRIPTPPCGRPVIPLVCEFCNEAFRYKMALMHHYIKEHPGNVYNCSRCNKNFENPQTWRSHVCKVGNYCCETCGLIFPHSSMLRRHLQTHDCTPPQFKCDECGKEFNKQTNLVRHQLRHTGERKFECTLCSARFKENRELVKHRFLVHSNNRPFQCTHCSRSFAFRYQAKRHMQVHTGLRPHKCTFENCGASLSSSSALKHHMYTHTGAKPYECEYCPATFRLKVNLSRHVKDQHEI